MHVRASYCLSCSYTLQLTLLYLKPILFFFSQAPAAPELKLEIPEFKAPDVKLDIPEVKAPDVKLPEFSAPKFSAPKFDMPKVEMPKADIPKLDIPKVDMPKVDAPKVNLPSAPSFSVPQSSFEMPKVPSFSVPQSSYESVEGEEELEPQEVRDERAREARSVYNEADADAKVSENRARCCTSFFWGCPILRNLFFCTNAH